MHIGIGIPLRKGGSAGQGLPLPADIVSLYRQSKVAASGTAYTDVRPGVGDYEAGKGVSLLFSGAQYGQLVDSAGDPTSVTLVGGFTVKFDLTVEDSVAIKTVFSGPINSNGELVVNVTANGTLRIIGYNGTTLQAVLEYIIGEDGTPHAGEVRYDSTTGTIEVYVDGDLKSSDTWDTGVELAVAYVGSRQTSNVFLGNLYDIHITDSTGVKFSNFLAQGGTSGYCESQVGPAVELNGFNLDTCWTESIEYGHIWEDYSDVENLLKWSEDFTTPKWQTSNGTTLSNIVTASAPDVYVYQDLLSGLVGNTPTYSIKVRGIGNTIGKTFRLLAQFTTGSALVDVLLTSEEQTVSVDATPTNETLRRFRFGVATSESGDQFYVSDAWLKINDKAYTKTTTHAIQGKIPQSPTIPTQDIFGNLLTNPRAGRNDMPVTGYTGNWDGATEYLTNAGLVGTETVITSTGTSTPTVSAGRIDFTAGTCSYLLLSNGDELIIESRKDGAQPSVWDRINGNEYVIVDATFGVDGFWSIEKAGSKLLEGGFTEGEVDGVELWVNPTPQTTDANNYSTYDAETGIGRIVSDGAAVSLSIPALTGATYKYHIHNVTGTGEIYLRSSLSVRSNIGAGSDIIGSFLSTADTFYVYRSGPCDVTFKLSVQKIPVGQIPADPNTGLSALAQPLTNTPGQFGGGTDGVELGTPLNTHTAVGGAQNVTSNSFDTISTGGLVSSPLIIGKKYKLIVTRATTTASSVTLHNNDGSDTFPILQGTGSVIFTAVLAKVYLRVVGAGATTYEYSVQAIDTSALAPIKVYAPDSLAFYNLCVLAGVDEDLYLDGEPIGLTPLEVVALTPTGNLANAIFRSITKDTFLVGYNPALTGTDITKAERYLGI